MLKDITLFIQILTAIIAVILYRKFDSNFMRFLTSILVCSALIEIWAVYFDNLMIWIGYTINVFSLIYFLFRTLIVDSKVLKLMLSMAVLLFVFGLVCFYRNNFFSYLIILGSFNTSVFAFFYLRQLLLSDMIFDYKLMLPFWVTVAFFMFYMACVPFFLILKYMNDRSVFYILQMLVIIMNCIIIFGFLWSKKNKSYS